MEPTTYKQRPLSTTATEEAAYTVDGQLSEALSNLGDLDNMLRGCLVSIRGSQPESGVSEVNAPPQCIREKLDSMRQIVQELNQKAIEIRNHLS